ncbi:hypothetical protein Q3G72_010329 [Acer saccharum]|nr:hypothetical protein Q3G72_010329 [Acer saccharum]
MATESPLPKYIIHEPSPYCRVTSRPGPSDNPRRITIRNLCSLSLFVILRRRLKTLYILCYSSVRYLHFLFRRRFAFIASSFRGFEIVALNYNSSN